MALKENFYEEIYEEEKNWIDLINSDLLNVYYLPELRKFYHERQLRLSYEYELTLNPIIKSMSHLLNNIIVKLDYIMSEHKKDNPIDVKELKNYFLMNQLNNNLSYSGDYDKIEENKGIYSLRKKVVSEELDDDFYYSEQKVA